MFGVDLISFIMERRKMDWKFHKYFLKNVPASPFTPLIQKIVSTYLEKEESNIYFLYMSKAKTSQVDSITFHYLIEYIRCNVFNSVESVTDLIRYCTLITQCSFLAYQNGVHLAPFGALRETSQAMKTFIANKKESPHAFWTSLDSNVLRLLPESFTSSEVLRTPIKHTQDVQKANIPQETSPEEPKSTLQEQRQTRVLLQDQVKIRNVKRDHMGVKKAVREDNVWVEKYTQLDSMEVEMAILEDQIQVKKDVQEDYMEVDKIIRED